MKVLVDYELCEGHGQCVAAAPEVFDLDEEGYKVVLLLDEIPEELQKSTSDAVKFCPVVALSLQD